MNVLSLFDGLSCTQIALDRGGIFRVDNYYASEVDKYAMQVTLKNYPNTHMLGDVTKWESWDFDWSTIDLVVGGFPCQAWSNAGHRKGDRDPRGMLFWTMLDIISKVQEHNPNAYFLMENVRMKGEFEEYITYHTKQALGKVNKHLINSALVSAQNRQRYYWTNIEGITQPKDRGLVLRDILDSDYEGDEVPNNPRNQRHVKQPSDKSLCMSASMWKGAGNNGMTLVPRPCELKDFNEESTCHHAATATDIKGNESIKRVYADSGKAPTLTTMGGGHREPKVLCGRVVGRRINPVTNKRDDYNYDIKPKQRFEARKDDKSGTLSTVQKDNVLKVKGGALRNQVTKRGIEAQLNIRKDDKSNCVVSSWTHKLNGCVEYREEEQEPTYRKLTVSECERLQTVPLGYTEGVSNTQRYKMLGNGFTVAVVEHIFKHIQRQEK